MQLALVIVIYFLLNILGRNVAESLLLIGLALPVSARNNLV